MITKNKQRINISFETFLDLVNIAENAFHPLETFLNYNDLISVVHTCHLENGEVWSLPILLPVEDSSFSQISNGEEYDLYFNDAPVASITVEDKYKIEKKKIAELVFRTVDKSHPGVNKLFNDPDYAISGKLTFDQDLLVIKEDPYHLSPKKAKEKIQENGWKTVIGFQTRNVPHRAHEYLQRCGLEIADGILLQPISGWKKKGDYKAEIVFESYRALIDNYYPKNRVLLCSLSTSMRYAGPREAVFHAIIRRNYGCTHFIVGRDHAGVGNYYKKYDAHEIFDSVGDVGIIPVLFHEPFYCKKCGMMATDKTCNHGDWQRMKMSGTHIRDMILNGGNIPEILMRKEVVDVIERYLKKSDSVFY